MLTRHECFFNSQQNTFGRLLLQLLKYEYASYSKLVWPEEIKKQKPLMHSQVLKTYSLKLHYRVCLAFLDPGHVNLDALWTWSFGLSHLTQ